jgi:hypothetical protein
MGLVALPSPALPTGTLWSRGNIGFHPIGRRRLASLQFAQPLLERRQLSILVHEAAFLLDEATLPTGVKSEVLGPFLLSKDDLARRTEPRHVIGVKGSRLNSSGPERTIHSDRRQARS